MINQSKTCINRGSITIKAGDFDRKDLEVEDYRVFIGEEEMGEVVWEKF